MEFPTGLPEPGSIGATPSAKKTSGNKADGTIEKIAEQAMYKADEEAGSKISKPITTGSNAEAKVKSESDQAAVPELDLSNVGLAKQAISQQKSEKIVNEWILAIIDKIDTVNAQNSGNLENTKELRDLLHEAKRKSTQISFESSSHPRLDLTNFDRAKNAISQQNDETIVIHWRRQISIEKDKITSIPGWVKNPESSGRWDDLEELAKLTGQRIRQIKIDTP